MPNPTLDADRLARASLEEALASLDLDWSVMRDLTFGAAGAEVAIDYVVAHNDRGIALVDLAPGPSVSPVSPFRRLLRQEGFFDRFPGRLPVVHFVATADDAPEIDRLLEEAFAASEPLTMEGADWVDRLNEILGETGEPSLDVPVDEEPPTVIMPPRRPAPARDEGTARTPPPVAPVPETAPERTAARPSPAADALRLAAERASRTQAADRRASGRAPAAFVREEPALSVEPRRRWRSAVAALAIIAAGSAIAIAGLDYFFGPAPSTRTAEETAPMPPAAPAHPAPAPTPPPPAAASAPATPTPPAPTASAPPPPPPPPAVAVQRTPPAASAPPTPPPVVTNDAPPPAPAASSSETAAAKPAPPPPAAPPKPSAAPTPSVAATPLPAPAAPPVASAPPPPPPPAPAASAPTEIAEQPPTPAEKPMPPPVETAALPPASEPEPAPAQLPKRSAVGKPTPLLPHAKPANTRNAAPRQDEAEPQDAAQTPQARRPVAAARSEPRAGDLAPQRGSSRNGPPVDADDLPPLEAFAVPPSRPAAPAAPAPVASTSRAAPESAGSSAQAGTDTSDCRPYTSMTSLMGQQRQVSGIACRQPDGRWKLMSEMPR